MDDILTIIRKKKNGLTKKQRIVAEYMLEHQDEMSYITLRDLSRKIGVTEITILNTCQALGFEGINAVKYEFRKAHILEEKTDVIDEISTYNIGVVPGYELSDKEQFLKEVGTEEIGMLKDYWASVDLHRIFEAAELCTGYDRVFICGRGFSYTVAELLQNYLSYGDIYASVVNTELNDNTYGMLPVLKPDTLVIVISFPDYYYMTTKVAEFAKKAGAKLLAVTDREDTEVARLADLVLAAPTRSRIFMNTLSAVMMMLNLFASALTSIQPEKSSFLFGRNRL